MRFHLRLSEDVIVFSGSKEYVSSVCRRRGPSAPSPFRRRDLRGDYGYQLPPRSTYAL